MTSTQTYSRIAIIGGGPGGLILLRTLHHRGVPATLYERETSATSRAHLGGTLDLAWQSGQRAFRDNGLEDEFTKHSRAEGEEYKICDADANVLFHRGESGSAGEDVRDPEQIRPEIDRSDIRKILVAAVPAASIQWGHALVAARPLAGSPGAHELEFANGVRTVCDVLVGADGAYSRVRPLVSPAQPEYVGINGAELTVSAETMASAAGADAHALVGNGMMFAIRDGKMLVGQRNSGGRVRTYAWFKGAEDWVLPGGVGAARRALLEMYAGWAPVLRKLVELADEDAVHQRALYMLPEGHRWAHVAGVTLLGDAAHMITPYAGSGANLAMLDGLELGILLAEAVREGKSVEAREAAVAEWEEKMCAMAAKEAALCKAGVETGFGPESPGVLVEMAKTFLTQQRDV